MQFDIVESFKYELKLYDGELMFGWFSHSDGHHNQVYTVKGYESFCNFLREYYEEDYHIVAYCQNYKQLFQLEYTGNPEKPWKYQGYVEDLFVNVPVDIYETDTYFS
jgi:hypothetical protein